MSATFRHAGTMERPGRGVYVLELRRRPGEARPADLQRQSVYQWEREVLGLPGREHDSLIGPYSAADTRSVRADARKPADAYLVHLWQSYAADFAPFFTGVPRLRIGWCVCLRVQTRSRAAAHASALRHEIYCTSAVRRTTLVHEVAHLFTWNAWQEGGHGPQFCAALVYLWEREFGIGREHAIAVAERMRVAIDGIA
jgi:hypothetical protein